MMMAEQAGAYSALKFRSDGAIAEGRRVIVHGGTLTEMNVFRRISSREKRVSDQSDSIADKLAGVEPIDIPTVAPDAPPQDPISLPPPPGQSQAAPPAAYTLVDEAIHGGVIHHLKFTDRNALMYQLTGVLKEVVDIGYTNDQGIALKRTNVYFIGVAVNDGREEFLIVRDMNEGLALVPAAQVTAVALQHTEITSFEMV